MPKHKKIHDLIEQRDLWHYEQNCRQGKTETQICGHDENKRQL